MTDYHTTVALKLTIAQCVNTALIAIIVNNDKDSWFTPGGLVVDMTWIFLSNAFISPLVYLLSPPYLFKRIRMWLAQRNDKIMTQKEANELFEGPPVDMAQRYANIMKTTIVTFAYAPIIPLGFLISLAGLFLEYWIDKYVLLNRHSRPVRFGSDLSSVMTHILPYAVFIYAVMTYVFMDELSPDISLPAFVWMWIVFVYLFFPLDRCCRACSKWDIEKG